MQIHTKGRVAIEAILDLATHDASQPVALARISARLAVSLSYLEQLFSKLRQKGIVAGHRGHGGGYSLVQDLATISVADVLDAVDSAAFHCGSRHGGSCDPSGRDCETGCLWCRLDDHLTGYLRTVPLAAVLADMGVAQRLRQPAIYRSGSRTLSGPAPPDRGPEGDPAG